MDRGRRCDKCVKRLVSDRETGTRLTERSTAELISETVRRTSIRNDESSLSHELLQQQVGFVSAVSWTGLCVHVSRYRKLLEAAKDVDSFTRFVVERYAELHRHLPLDRDEHADDGLRHESFDHDPRSTQQPSPADHQRDDMPGASQHRYVEVTSR